MRILVTGGCGFAGSHTCEYFRNKGATVTSFDNLTTYELRRTGYAVMSAREHNKALLRSFGVTMATGDIRDLDKLSFYAKQADFIIHTAAQPAVTISLEDPVLDFTTNVIGTFNVLECARKYAVPTVSCATIHVYGNSINDRLVEQNSRYRHVPGTISEAYPLGGGTLTPLHASKISGDMLVKAYADSFNLPVASFRLTGLYGTRQFGGEDHGWVANFVIRALTGKPITVYGTGKQVRDILYVDDLVKAFERFYRYQKPGVYNIGGGPSARISLLETLELIQRLSKKRLSVSFKPGRKGDLRYFVCNKAKAEKMLHWQPRVLPRVGITRMLSWTKKNIHLFTS